VHADVRKASSNATKAVLLVLKYLLSQKAAARSVDVNLNVVCKAVKLAGKVGKQDVKEDHHSDEEGLGARPWASHDCSRRRPSPKWLLHLDSSRSRDTSKECEQSQQADGATASSWTHQPDFAVIDPQIVVGPSLCALLPLMRLVVCSIENPMVVKSFPKTLTELRSINYLPPPIWKKLFAADYR
jgi:hypothetical protein